MLVVLRFIILLLVIQSFLVMFALSFKFQPLPRLSVTRILRPLSLSTTKYFSNHVQEELSKTPILNKTKGYNTNSFHDPSNPYRKPKDFLAISFYLFIDISSNELEYLKNVGEKMLRENPEFKGTLLIAPEGYNGQFAIPAQQLEVFHSKLKEINPRIFNTIDFNLGQTLYNRTIYDKYFPFKKCLFKLKKEILTDKLDNITNWYDNGEEVDAPKWHQELLQVDPSMNINPNDTSPILLDCRNDYESDVGKFRNAIPLNTNIFTQTWDELEVLLKDVPHDRRILTYCTGGIRCEKVNAYLKQRMGYQNIGRLKKGIIAYERWIQSVNQENQQKDVIESNSSDLSTTTPPSSNNQNPTTVTSKEPVPNLFVGVNFLFDRRRLGKPIPPLLLTNSQYRNLENTVE